MQFYNVVERWTIHHYFSRFFVLKTNYMFTSKNLTWFIMFLYWFLFGFNFYGIFFYWIIHDNTDCSVNFLNFLIFKSVISLFAIELWDMFRLWVFFFVWIKSSKSKTVSFRLFMKLFPFFFLQAIQRYSKNRSSQLK